VDTSATACDITLPDPVTAFSTFASASWTLVVQDEANNAVVNNITVKRLDPATKINNQAADIMISTNSGRLSFYTNGTDWFAA